MPGQMLVALREIEHQSFCTLVMHPFCTGAKLDCALAQLPRIDQRVVRHDELNNRGSKSFRGPMDVATAWLRHPTPTWRLHTAPQKPADELLAGSGTFPDRMRCGLDTVGTARRGVRGVSRGLLI
jgi:hypothetical protein